MQGRLTATQQQNGEQDNLAGDPCPRQGATQGRGAAGNAVYVRSSGGGSGNNDGRVQENTLGNIGMGTRGNVQFPQGDRNVQVSQEVGPSAQHRVHTRSGRGSRTPGRGGDTPPGSGQGFHLYRHREQANPMQHVSSPQQTIIFSLEPNLRAPHSWVGGVCISWRRWGGAGVPPAHCF